MGRIVNYALLALAMTSAALAQPLAPGLVNYQGQLRDDQGQPLATADYAMTFALHSDAIGDTVVWGPQTFPAVPVAQGHFNVILGPEDDSARSLAAAFASEERYLEITVSGAAIGPRQRILSAPFALSANTAFNGVPAGGIIPFAGGAVPAGWLRCDGSEVTREVEASLFAAIGTSWGVGNGSTTFNLPDLRGQFLRGVDRGTGVDPNADVRRAVNGGNAGDAVGSYQDWGTGRPRTGVATTPGAVFDTNFPGNHNHTRTHVSDFGSDQRGFPNGSDQSGVTNTTSAGNHSHIIDGGGNSETRPDNAAVEYIIKR